MKILVIGGGGREHALVWKLAQSKLATKIFCAPGNPGIAQIAECVPIAATDVAKLADFVQLKCVGLTVVGPEAPLCAGIVDYFRQRRLRIFGPSKDGAQMEGSKVFSKRFFLKHGVPTGRAEIFTDANAARDCVRNWGAPVVVKADGLAAGKGVIVAQTVEQAEQAIADIMVKKVFGDAGNQLIVEECLVGEEASVMALTDGKTFRILAAAQDHKRVGDGDSGPNTGGMGAYSPTPAIDKAPTEQAESDETPRVGAAIRNIFERTLDGLQADGIDYRGVLYAGIMLTKDRGPMLLEYNCRFGDPETQVVLPRMDFDLAEVCRAVADGNLGDMALNWKPEAAVCVVLASGGYPGDYAKGRIISGLDDAAKLPGVTVFHAGTKAGANGAILTDGGRVLGVTALGDGIAGAVARAYDAVARIRFDGMHYRRDIAARALGAQRKHP
jgi:phosphoribosylamine--glycine ligase